MAKRCGFAGLVLHIASRGIIVRSAEDTSGTVVEVTAGRGIWNSFAELHRQSPKGKWNALAVPWLQPATPIQNVGAYGCEVEAR